MSQIENQREAAEDSGHTSILGEVLKSMQVRLQMRIKLS